MSTGPKAAAILARQLAVPGDRGVESPGTGVLERALGEVRRLAEAGLADEAATRAGRLLEWAPLGLRLTQPWRVVVVGPPNAGKSSLVNAIAGFARSIVAPEAGTTRDLLETRIVLDGWEVILVDTAGLRDVAADATERQGIDRARDAVRTADLVVEVSEARQPPVAAEGAIGNRHGRVLRVVTKVDLAGAARSAEDVERRIPTSAITGEGIGTLVTAILRVLVPEEPGTDVPVPFTHRQVAALKSPPHGGEDGLIEESHRTAPPPA
jgi:tRNA modification GTPase